MAIVKFVVGESKDSQQDDKTEKDKQSKDSIPNKPDDIQSSSPNTSAAETDKVQTTFTFKTSFHVAFQLKSLKMSSIFVRLFQKAEASIKYIQSYVFCHYRHQLKS